MKRRRARSESAGGRGAQLDVETGGLRPELLEQAAAALRSRRTRLPRRYRATTPLEAWWRRTFRGIVTFREANNMARTAERRAKRARLVRQQGRTALGTDLANPAGGRGEDRDRRKRRGRGHGGKTTNTRKRQERGWGERRT